MTKQRSFWRQSRTSLLGVLLFAIAASLTATAAETKPRKEKSDEATEAHSGSAPKQRTVSLTFRQMGAWSSVKLRGVEGSQTLGFSIRADEIVVGAKLRIAYDYSPSLLPDLSHLRILLNERVAMVEALPQNKGVGNTREINLDPRLFGENNELRFNLIGHYTRQCEDPFHTSLWLTVSDLSRLELTLAPISGSNDLKNLPAPFFDSRDNMPLKLPFVFTSTPSFGTIKAAGIVASWFGLQAGSRGAQFPVHMNTLPDGNAVIFMQAGESIGGLRGGPGATVSVLQHPTNSLAKLLLVTGGNDEELARAARALALVSPTFTGQSVAVTKETDAAPRKPYDAPAWVPLDRPVRLGELARPTELRVQGYFPEVIRVNYRVPPDVFTWRTPGAPMKLKYRATRLPEHRNSSLAVGLNSSFLHTVALNEPYKKAVQLGGLMPVSTTNHTVREESLFVPPYTVGGRDQLQFTYAFEVIRDGECKNLPPNNLQGAIDPETTIDFSGFPQYAEMPNLGYFANIGYPYTRLADLSETAVVLPDRPNADELGLYMTLMGRMGEATGYPSIRHAVITAADVDKSSDRDLIVIGSSNSQMLMSKWGDLLPMIQINGERRVRAPAKSWLPTYRWDRPDDQSASVVKGSLSFVGNGSLAAIMGFESPLQASRSVVFLHADRPADLRKIADVLIDSERMSQIQGDFAIIDDKSVNFTKVSPTYTLGSLPAFSKLRWFFSDHPLLFAFIALTISALLAALGYRSLRRLMSKRFKKAPLA
ncbi:cellulose biosynthesis cyclic di-GMP-binding regulatory protein BcsB [Noviherbaspirillum saxi]|uniref:Cyclic di-GMP-binding protein n=1 Tax=Noviherbaspirillum saxi TaxID=2320863 RepID=A0A3A3FH07_9BURK|nr:cellulose biosynthesis cyclic di-GMP-binding regulatory protein BcsB [Noviherbaspirillum saxi]RJF92427.1 cellulose biosynthesis cyclic di-GMP-binding regulatory protein BcsB [Noviherbaspirillum saxi]